MHKNLELVIDQAEGKNFEVIDAINETLNSCENAGLVTGWTWTHYADVLPGSTK